MAAGSPRHRPRLRGGDVSDRYLFCSLFLVAAFVFTLVIATAAFVVWYRFG